MGVNDVRKNFVFKKEVAEHLEELAKRDGKSMTMVVQGLIEERYHEISVQEKLEAFNNILKFVETSQPNKFLEQFDKDDNKVLQKVKGMME